MAGSRFLDLMRDYIDALDEMMKHPGDPEQKQYADLLKPEVYAASLTYQRTPW